MWCVCTCLQVPRDFKDPVALKLFKRTGVAEDGQPEIRLDYVRCATLTSHSGHGGMQAQGFMFVRHCCSPFWLLSFLVATQTKCPVSARSLLPSLPTPLYPHPVGV